MSRIFNTEQKAARAKSLKESGAYNGFELVFVTLDSAVPATYAWLELECFNAMALNDIAADIGSAAKTPAQIFSISGGSRIKGDADNGLLQVIAVDYDPANSSTIRLQVAPVGDYSRYTLTVDTGSYDFDPLFAEIPFKFRPGCFNTNCAPLSDYQARAEEPPIDYLAKDFNSFKHVMINAMRERVPDWKPTSEADLDQVLIDLIAADADELSDFQDRVMNEAYLGRARKRVSLARYARLLDYHIHEGNQAGTWLALSVTSDVTLDRSFGAWTGEDWQDDGSAIFVSDHTADNTRTCFVDLNELALYTWGGVVTALEAGSTQADIALDPDGMATLTAANDLAALLQREDVTHLLIEQKLNPETGTVNGVDKTARQVLELLPSTAAAEVIEDPVAGRWFVRVYWQASDALTRRYCFVTDCPNLPPAEGVSAFHGNLIQVTHGRPHVTTFRAEDASLAATDADAFVYSDEAHFETSRRGVLCRIPHQWLAYRYSEPGGEDRTRTTLTVEVDGIADTWEERPDLIDSQADDFHFIVETDERRYSSIRFGNNENGRALDEDAVITCRYQTGRGIDGNVGADTLTGFDNSATGFPDVENVWNPLDVTIGREPEKRAEIVRRAPQAYRAHQLRAVTLEDYVNRAEELDDVSHAYARYAWTGSWRTVQLSIDPAGTDELSDSVREKVEAYLDAVRLIGEDLEVRAARYVSLDILLRVCAHPHYWPEDLADELAKEFSNTYTADGRPGFFHPDRWTFGQPLHASQVIGRALSVTGVERVLLLSMRRWYANSGPHTGSVSISPAELGTSEIDTLAVQPFEIVRVDSDPNHLEKGRIQFDIVGGRQ